MPISYNDNTSFSQKSIGQMSFSRQVMVMSVGQNVRASNININWGDRREFRWRDL